MRCTACRATIENAYVCSRCAFNDETNKTRSREREPQIESAGRIARFAQERLARDVAQQHFAALQALEDKAKPFGRPDSVRNTMILERKNFGAYALLKQLRELDGDAGYSRVGSYIVDNNRYRRKRNRIAYVVWWRAWLRMWTDVGRACAKA